MSVLTGPSSAPPPAFSAGAMLGLLLAAVLAAAGYALVSAYAPELRNGEGGANALSASATGYSGAVRLMRFLDHRVVINRSDANRRFYRGLMVLTPERPLAAADLRASYPRLVVLPKWATAEDSDHSGWVRKVGVVDPGQAARIVPSSVGSFTLIRAAGPAKSIVLHSGGSSWPATGIVTGPIAQLQTGAGANLWPVVTDAVGRIVVGVMPDSHTYVLTDPDLLNTQGVADGNTARAAAVLLSSLAGSSAPMAFDVTLNGIGGAKSLLRLALEPPFLGATVCLLAAASLIGLQAWNRFGPALRSQRAVALGKTALAENGASMVRLARREPRMALRYVRLCRQRAAAALGADHLEPAALNDFLDRWAERVGAQDRMSALVDEAMRVRKAADLAPLARRARRWRLEMTRESG